MERPPSAGISQNQATWAIVVLWVIFDDLAVLNGVLNIVA
jgi:hypothetical protein